MCTRSKFHQNILNIPLVIKASCPERGGGGGRVEVPLSCVLRDLINIFPSTGGNFAAKAFKKLITYSWYFKTSNNHWYTYKTHLMRRISGYTYQIAKETIWYSPSCTNALCTFSLIVFPRPLYFLSFSGIHHSHHHKGCYAIGKKILPVCFFLALHCL